MRQIILLPFILFFSVANGQCFRINDSTVECAFSFLSLKSREQASSYGVLKTAKNPHIYIVDGVITNEAEIKKLDPDNIESISVLKKATKIILCHQPLNDVIVIATKTGDQRTIIVKDMFNGEVLPGASVEIISTETRKNSIQLIADSSGRVVTNKIANGKVYELRVSNIGYKTYTDFIDAAVIKKGYSALLQRNYAELRELVIVAYPPTVCRRIVCYNHTQRLRCDQKGVAVIKSFEDSVVPKNQSRTMELYPNPVIRSQKVSIKFESLSAGKITLRLFSVDNKLIDTKEFEILKGVNRIDYFIGSQLSSGVYIIQLVDGSDRFITSGKIIVQ